MLRLRYERRLPEVHAITSASFGQDEMRPEAVLVEWAGIIVRGVALLAALAAVFACMVVSVLLAAAIHFLRRLEITATASDVDFRGVAHLQKGGEGTTAAFWYIIQERSVSNIKFVWLILTVTRPCIFFGTSVFCHLFRRKGSHCTVKMFQNFLLYLQLLGTFALKCDISTEKLWLPWAKCFFKELTRALFLSFSRYTKYYSGARVSLFSASSCPPLSSLFLLKKWLQQYLTQRNSEVLYLGWTQTDCTLFSHQL